METADIKKDNTQIERKINITYRWWRDDEKEIDTRHAEALEETAQNMIFQMMIEGYMSGELNDNVHMNDNDPKDGVTYNGWWEASY
mgnify:FL=1